MPQPTGLVEVRAVQLAAKAKAYPRWLEVTIKEDPKESQAKHLWKTQDVAGDNTPHVLNSKSALTDKQREAFTIVVDAATLATSGVPLTVSVRNTEIKSDGTEKHQKTEEVELNVAALLDGHPRGIEKSVALKFNDVAELTLSLRILPERESLGHFAQLLQELVDALRRHHGEANTARLCALLRATIEACKLSNATTSDEDIERAAALCRALHRVGTMWLPETLKDIPAPQKFVKLPQLFRNVGRHLGELVATGALFGDGARFVDSHAWYQNLTAAAEELVGIAGGDATRDSATQPRVAPYDIVAQALEGASAVAKKLHEGRDKLEALGAFASVLGSVAEGVLLFVPFGRALVASVKALHGAAVKHENLRRLMDRVAPRLALLVGIIADERVRKLILGNEMTAEYLVMLWTAIDDCTRLMRNYDAKCAPMQYFSDGSTTSELERRYSDVSELLQLLHDTVSLLHMASTPQASTSAPPERVCSDFKLSLMLSIATSAEIDGDLFGVAMIEGDTDPAEAVFGAALKDASLARTVLGKVMLTAENPDIATRLQAALLIAAKLKVPTTIAPSIEAIAASVNEALATRSSTARELQKRIEALAANTEHHLQCLRTALDDLGVKLSAVHALTKQTAELIGHIAGELSEMRRENAECHATTQEGVSSTRIAVTALVMTQLTHQCETIFAEFHRMMEAAFVTASTRYALSALYAKRFSEGLGSAKLQDGTIINLPFVKMFTMNLVRQSICGEDISVIEPQQIVALADNTTTHDDQQRIFVLEAPCGYGKSTMVKHLAITQLEAREYAVVVVDLPALHAASQHTIGVSFRVCLDVAQLDDQKLADSLHDGDVPIVWLFDGYDEISASVNQKLRNFLNSVFSGRTVGMRSRNRDIVILTTRPEFVELDPPLVRSSEVFRRGSRLTLNKWRPEHVLSYLHHAFSHVCAEAAVDKKLRWLSTSDSDPANVALGLVTIAERALKDPKMASWRGVPLMVYSVVETVIANPRAASSDAQWSPYLLIGGRLLRLWERERIKMQQRFNDGATTLNPDEVFSEARRAEAWKQATKYAEKVVHNQPVFVNDAERNSPNSAYFALQKAGIIAPFQRGILAGFSFVAVTTGIDVVHSDVVQRLTHMEADVVEIVVDEIINVERGSLIIVPQRLADEVSSRLGSQSLDVVAIRDSWVRRCEDAERRVPIADAELILGDADLTPFTTPTQFKFGHKSFAEYFAATWVADQVVSRDLHHFDLLDGRNSVVTVLTAHCARERGEATVKQLVHALDQNRYTKQDAYRKSLSSEMSSALNNHMKLVTRRKWQRELGLFTAFEAAYVLDCYDFLDRPLDFRDLRWRELSLEPAACFASPAFLQKVLDQTVNRVSAELLSAALICAVNSDNVAAVEILQRAGAKMTLLPAVVAESVTIVAKLVETLTPMPFEAASAVRYALNAGSSDVAAILVSKCDLSQVGANELLSVSPSMQLALRSALEQRSWSHSELRLVTELGMFDKICHRLDAAWSDEEKCIIDLHGVANLTEESLRKICVHFDHLTTLDLTGCYQVTNEWITFIASTCKSLSTLRLSGCSALTDTAVTAITAMATQLTTLTMAGCKLISSPQFSIGTTLTTLDLSGCELLDDTVTDRIGEACRALKTLKLSACSALASPGFRNCTGLTSLNLSGCFQLTDSIAPTLVSSCPMLRTLVLTHCSGLRSPEFSSFAELTLVDLSVCDQLHSVRFVGCARLILVNVSGCERMASPQFRRCPNLAILDVSWCKALPDTAVIDAGEECHALTTLNLSWCELLTDLSLRTIEQHLTHLLSLDIRGCPLLSNEAKERIPCLNHT